MILFPFFQWISQKSAKHPIEVIVFSLLLVLSFYLYLVNLMLFPEISLSFFGASHFPACISRVIEAPVNFFSPSEGNSAKLIFFEGRENDLPFLLDPLGKGRTLKSWENAEFESKIKGLLEENETAALAVFISNTEDIKSIIDERRTCSVVKQTLPSKRRFLHRIRMGSLLMADKFDMLFVVLGLCLMQFQFLRLFRNMRAVGSRFTLGFSVIISSALSFLIAFFLILLNGIKFNSLLLTESLPFIVIIIGFQKPSRLTRAILSEKGPGKVSDRISKGINSMGPVILKEYAKQILIFTLLIISDINGLVEFGYLATVYLIVHVFVLFSFYIAFVSLRLELIEIRRKSSESLAVISPRASTCLIEEESLSTSRFKSLLKFGFVLTYLANGMLLQDENYLIKFKSTEPLSLYINERIISLSTAFKSFIPSISFLNHSFDDYQGISNVSIKVFKAFLRMDSTSNETRALFTILIFLGFPILIFLDYYGFGVERDIQSDTRISNMNEENITESSNIPKAHSLEDSKVANLDDLSIVEMVLNKKIPIYALEKFFSPEEYERAVKIRRLVLCQGNEERKEALDSIPLRDFPYSRVHGSCCENVLGYIPIPLGYAGPLTVDGESFLVPMATTEGALIASTHRGAKVLTLSGGVITIVTRDEMTRGPCLEMPNIIRAGQLKEWVEMAENFKIVKEAFDSTSRYGRLAGIKTNLAGRLVYLRFSAFTGNAMGMNMISKGCEKALSKMKEYFPDLRIVSLSGNFCTDKKPSAINWIEGRGKSVVAEAIIPESIIKSVLKTSVKELVSLNNRKNLVGSCMAGSIGGFNAHAANIVTAIFLATGQDPAQNVESSNCLTLLEEDESSIDGSISLRMTCTMPSIEVGTIGGGTSLPAQSAALSLLDLVNNKDSSKSAQKLARIVAATVMAGELSLLASLAVGSLVSSHLNHNRKK